MSTCRNLNVLMTLHIKHYAGGPGVCLTVGKPFRLSASCEVYLRKGVHTLRDSKSLHHSWATPWLLVKLKKVSSHLRAVSGGPGLALLDAHLACCTTGGCPSEGQQDSQLQCSLQRPLCEELGSGVAEGFSHFLEGQQIVMEIENFFFILYIYTEFVRYRVQQLDGLGSRTAFLWVCQ